MNSINEIMESIKLNAVFDLAYHAIENNFNARVDAIINGSSDETVEMVTADMKQALADLHLAHKKLIKELGTWHQ